MLGVRGAVDNEDAAHSHTAPDRVPLVFQVSQAQFGVPEALVDKAQTVGRYRAATGRVDGGTGELREVQQPVTIFAVVCDVGSPAELIEEQDDPIDLGLRERAHQMGDARWNLRG